MLPWLAHLEVKILSLSLKTMCRYLLLRQKISMLGLCFPFCPSKRFYINNFIRVDYIQDILPSARLFTYCSGCLLSPLVAGQWKKPVIHVFNTSFLVFGANILCQIFAGTFSICGAYS